MEHRGFFDIRVLAESKAREYAKNGEAIFDEIYEEISKVLPDQYSNIKKLEFELEYEFCRANPFMKVMYDYALLNGKKILYISDMYHRKTFIGKLLRKQDIKRKIFLYHV